MSRVASGCECELRVRAGGKHCELQIVLRTRGALTTLVVRVDPLWCADFDKLAAAISGLAERGSDSSRAQKPVWEAPKPLLDCLTMLVLAISVGAFRDGLLSLATHAGCTPDLEAFIQQQVAGLVSVMHPAFARQTSEDTVGFAHMLIRNMRQLPPAAGGLSCEPVSPEVQQMIATFFKTCLARHQTGTDLSCLAERTLSGDMTTAVTREMVRLGGSAGASSYTAVPNKRPFYQQQHNASVDPLQCRDFARNACTRGSSCRYSHGPLATSLLLPPPPLVYPQAGRGGD
jgi:hypothetical protein